MCALTNFVFIEQAFEECSRNSFEFPTDGNDSVPCPEGSTVPSVGTARPLGTEGPLGPEGPLGTEGPLGPGGPTGPAACSGSSHSTGTVYSQLTYVSQDNSTCWRVVGNDSQSWAGAARACVELGGHLLTEFHRELNQVLDTQFAQNATWWIGLRNSFPYDDWVFNDNTGSCTVENEFGDKSVW